MGATWYTWLEQGRDVRASLEVLEAIARALRLTPAERTHLILLGRGEEAPACKPPAERASPSMRRLIAEPRDQPGYVIGRRWDYLAWNRAACALFGDFGTFPAGPATTCGRCSWTQSAASCSRTGRSVRLAVAKFRADSARHLGDPSFEELIQRAALVEPGVLPRRGSATRSPAPGTGARRSITRLPARSCSSTPSSTPSRRSEQRLILYSPSPDTDTAEKLAELLERDPEDLLIPVAA